MWLLCMAPPLTGLIGRAHILWPGLVMRRNGPFLHLLQPPLGPSPRVSWNLSRCHSRCSSIGHAWLWEGLSKSPPPPVHCPLQNKYAHRTLRKNSLPQDKLNLSQLCYSLPLLWRTVARALKPSRDFQAQHFRFLFIFFSWELQLDTIFHIRS